jgi:hypothetical protein
LFDKSDDVAFWQHERKIHGRRHFGHKFT